MNRKTVSTMFLFVAVVLTLQGSALADRTPEQHRVPASDGIELATDVWLPDKTPAPVILIRTPYGKQQVAYIAEPFAEAGYVVAVQDVRGRYDSGGEHEPFRHEEGDGLATLRWIEKQPWCNGRIGMWGSSYSGYAALVLADETLESFDSIFSVSGWLSVDQVVRPGGANHLLLNLPWMLTQQGRHQRSLKEFNVDALFRHTPLNEAMRAAGIKNSTWEDPEWLESTVEQLPTGKARRPIFHLTGWHDMVYQATLDAWQRLSDSADHPQKLAIGPWYHNQFLFGAWEVGDRNFGEASGLGTQEMIALSLRWFDATLREGDTGILKEPPVRYFLMEQNDWHAAKDWPPAGRAIRAQRWYLDSAGEANTADGDGKLSTAKPEESPADRFVFDPENPVPTLGGANFFYFPDLLGVRDQRETEKRDDVLVYTSAPLTEEMHVTGIVRARLNVGTSAKDTDFTAKLVVVEPDGYARIVEDGIARVGRTLATRPEPGKPFEIEVELGHTAISIPAGHRLRLEVSSSNFPKYDRNPNTGEDAHTARRRIEAEQTVYHSADRLSYLELPIRRKPLVATAATRRPLIEPKTADSDTTPVTGDDVDELIVEARQQMQDRQYDDAIATLKRVVELSPDNAPAHHVLGQAYLGKLNTVSMFKKLGLSKKVLASYRKSIELDPEDVDPRVSLASFYFNAPAIAGGGFDKGVEQVEMIRAKAPVRAHQLMARAYTEKKEPEKAKAEYQAAIAAQPEDPDLYYLLGLLCQNQKEWQEAFDAFAKGVEATGDARSLYQIGRTAVFSEQQLPRGEQALLQYIKDEPQGPALPSVASARWRLGMIYEHMDRIDRARSEYETALKLEPDLEQAREALETLQAAARADD